MPPQPHSRRSPFITPARAQSPYYFALSAQAIIFFNLMSSLAQPLGAGMDTALSTLLFGFIALSVLLSMPSLKKPCAKRAKTNTATTSSSAEKTENADLKA